MRQQSTRHVVAALFLAACAAGCGKKQAPEAAAMPATVEAQAAAAQATMAAAQQEMAKAAQQMQAQNAAAGAVDTVDFRKLKELLPAELAGIKRTDASGEKNETMGMRVSHAEGRYSDDDRSVSVEITDMGGVASMAAMAQMAWANVSIDRETDSGYERTTTVGGHKAFETYRTEGKSGQIEIIVASRFAVRIDGDGIPADALRKAAEALPLDKLAALAK